MKCGKSAFWVCFLCFCQNFSTVWESIAFPVCFIFFPWESPLILAEWSWKVCRHEYGMPSESRESQLNTLLFHTNRQASLSLSHRQTSIPLSFTPRQPQRLLFQPLCIGSVILHAWNGFSFCRPAFKNLLKFRLLWEIVYLLGLFWSQMTETLILSSLYLKRNFMALCDRLVLGELGFESNCVKGTPMSVRARWGFILFCLYLVSSSAQIPFPVI